MDKSNTLTPAQLATYAQPTGSGIPATPTTPSTTTPSGLLTPTQLASYAVKSNPANPASNVGSSWDAYDKAVAPPVATPPTDPNAIGNIGGTPVVGGILGGILKGADRVAATGQEAGQNIRKEWTNTPNDSIPEKILYTGGQVLKGTVNAAMGNIPGFQQFGQLLSSVSQPIIDKLGGIGAQDVAKPLIAMNQTSAELATRSADLAHQAINEPDPQKKQLLIDQSKQTYQASQEASKAAQSYQDQLAQGGRRTDTLQNVAPWLLGLTEGKTTPENVVSGTKTAATEAGNIASDVATVAQNKASTLGTGNTPSILDQAKVIDQYNRAIRPTVVGKGNAGQIANASDNVISGLKTIADNKDTLQFTDSSGNIIKGQTPTTVDQLSQSIAQTKSNIFKQYNDIATKAGDQGLKVDASGIASELDPVIQSKSLAISNPAAVKYAQAAQARLTQAGGVDALTAQEVIQNYNAELKAYYRNPTPGMASNVQIDALIANKFREALDNGIANTTGAEYQSLKNQYGALSSMEKDVAHRATVWGRQNKVGLAANISNVASGAELVRGLLTGNPVDVAIGGTIKGIQLYQKYLNNPDVGVSKIFDAINESNVPPTPKAVTPEFVPKSQTGKMIQEAAANNTQGGFVAVPDFPKSLNSRVSEVVKAMADNGNISGAKSFPADVANQIKQKAMDWQTSMADRLGIPYNKVNMDKFFNDQLAAIPKGKGANPSTTYSPELRNQIENNVLGDKSKAVIIDSDAIKEAHPAYDPKNPAPLHPESSAIAQDLYKKAIQQDTSGQVNLMAGGTASAKSEVALTPLRNTPSVILDGTLGKYDKAVQNIDYALKNGKDVTIHAVYSPVELSTVLNELRPRTVGSAPFIDTHAGYRATLPKLMEKYGDQINVKLYETSKFGEKGQAITPASVKSYVDSKILTRQQVMIKNFTINNAIKLNGLDWIKTNINRLIGGDNS